VLGVAGVAVLCVVALVVGVVVSRPDPVTPVAQDAQGPVLLVPGYGGDTTSLDVLADALQQDGRDVTVVALEPLLLERVGEHVE